MSDYIKEKNDFNGVDENSNRDDALNRINDDINTIDLFDRRSFLKKSASITIGAGAAFGSSLISNSLFSTSFTTSSAYASNNNEQELKIGYIPITDATPLLIAYSLGFFKEEGLIVPKPVMVRSWTVLSESFIGGQFNFTHLMFPIPIWMRFKQKIPVKVLAWDHTNGSALTVRGDSNIRGFGDLGGRQIAVPSWYSTHNYMVQMGIMAKGLKPVIKPQGAVIAPDEVNLFVLPPPEMPPALLGKKMDGFIVAEPFNALAEMKIKGRIMRFTGDIWKNHPCCVVVSHENFIKTQPAMIQKAINAVVRAQLWCTKNPEKAANILSRDKGDGYLPVNEDVLLRVFTKYDLKDYLEGEPPRPIIHPEWNIGRIGFQPYPYPSATKFIINQMAKTKVEGDSKFLKDIAIDPNLAIAELVDDTFVKKAMKNMSVYGTFDSNNKDVVDPNIFSREEVIEIG
ncbi:MAG: ABC transporter substrate-binding protein [Desulfamplus sp.]|nr:ABC transporter substrate-binding protein [Desulfamplus sp.]